MSDAPARVTRDEAIRIVRGASYESHVRDAAPDIVDRLVLEGILILDRTGEQ